MKLKIIALMLALTMLMAGFVGCGKTDVSSGSASSGSSVTSEPSSGSTDSSNEDTEKITKMFAAAYEKYDPDTVVMTINDTDITWREYYPWLFSMAQQIINNYGTEVVWSDIFNEEYSYQAYAQYYAESMVSQYVVIDNAAKELGLELTDEEKTELESIKQSDADNYSGGDLEAFKDYLSTIYITEDYYDFINSTSMFYYDIFEHYFGENGNGVSDEDALSYASDVGYMHAKHILFMTVDDAGEALDDAAIAEKRAAAEDALSQLNACKDTEELNTLFDKLMNELSEDSGLAYYPDGYYFVAGDMVEPFENAVKELEDNKISGIVESDYGFHIIMRLPINPDDNVEYDSSGNLCNLRYITASSKYQAITDEWFNALDIKYVDEFVDMDFSALFAM